MHGRSCKPLGPTVVDRPHFASKLHGRRIQQLLAQFWVRWRREFLPNLNVRRKWFEPKRNLKQGDVVLLVEPKSHRGDWPLGRIVATHAGEDGLVRVARVRVGTAEYLRPVNRLCPLEYQNNWPPLSWHCYSLSLFTCCYSSLPSSDRSFFCFARRNTNTLYSGGGYVSERNVRNAAFIFFVFLCNYATLITWLERVCSGASNKKSQQSERQFKSVLVWEQA